MSWISRTAIDLDRWLVLSMDDETAGKTIEFHQERSWAGSLESMADSPWVVSMALHWDNF